MPPVCPRVRRRRPGQWRLPGRTAASVLALVIALASIGAGRRAAAAVLGSVQQGQVVLGPGERSVRVSITAVDPARSFLVVSAHVSPEARSPSDAHVAGRLDGVETLVFERDGDAGHVTVAWSVVQFASGVSVRRGTAVADGSNPEIAVDVGPVDLQRSFPLLTHRGPGVQFGCNDFVRARLEAPGTLRLGRRCAGLPTTIDWQVIEHDRVRVRTGEVSMAVGAGTTKVPVPPIDREASWLLFSYESAAGTPADTGQKLVRGQIENPALIAFDRGSTGQDLTITYYVVTFEDGTQVRQGASSFAAGSDMVTAPITPVAPARSIAAMSTSLGVGRAASVDGTWSAGRFSVMLANAGEVLVRRGTVSSVPAELTWAVLEFPGEVADGGVADAGGGDAGASDARTAGDAGAADARPLADARDTGNGLSPDAVDGGAASAADGPDGGQVGDGGVGDGGVGDGGVGDGGAADAASDGGEDAPAVEVVNLRVGCACGVARAAPRPGMLPVSVVLVVFLVLRRGDRRGRRARGPEPGR